MNTPGILNNFIVSPVVVPDSYVNIGLTCEPTGYTRNTFTPIYLPKKNDPLIIKDKRWYYLLVSRIEYTRMRALMDDYSIADISRHVVACFTPDYLPGSNIPFKNKKGEPRRIYAFFDSYLELYDYIHLFDENFRAFYEIIFGELYQKPHFDLDISQDDVDQFYPGEDINFIANGVVPALIESCKEVLQTVNIGLDIAKDVLLYTSHGDTKRSYHIVINNKCHNGNKEAKAFYDLVIEKFKKHTNGKYICFVDAKVYSPRQQFRLVNCQKQNSGRPKIFKEILPYNRTNYQHIFTEDVSDPNMKERVILYESMVSFTSGCQVLPSFIPVTSVNHHSLSDFPDVTDNVVDRCMKLLHNTMYDILDGYTTSTFTYKQSKGHLILLDRHRPTYCHMCKKIHEKEHPFIFILNAKVYFDCRRSEQYNKGCPKIFLGHLLMSPDEIQLFMEQDVEQINNEDDEEIFAFGGFDIGPSSIPKETVEVKVVKNVHPSLVSLNRDYEALNGTPLQQAQIQRILETKLGNKDVQMELAKLNKDRINKIERNKEDGTYISGILSNIKGVFTNQSFEK